MILFIDWGNITTDELVYMSLAKMRNIMYSMLYIHPSNQVQNIEQHLLFEATTTVEGSKIVQKDYRVTRQRKDKQVTGQHKETIPSVAGKVTVYVRLVSVSWSVTDTVCPSRLGKAFRALASTS